MKKTITTILIFMLTLLAFTSCDNSAIFSAIAEKNPSDNRSLSIIGELNTKEIVFKSNKGIEKYNPITKAYSTISESTEAKNGDLFWFTTDKKDIIALDSANENSNKYYAINIESGKVTATTVVDEISVKKHIQPEKDGKLILYVGDTLSVYDSTLSEDATKLTLTKGVDLSSTEPSSKYWGRTNNVFYFSDSEITNTTDSSDINIDRIYTFDTSIETSETPILKPATFKNNGNDVAISNLGTPIAASDDNHIIVFSTKAVYYSDSGSGEYTKVGDVSTAISAKVKSYSFNQGEYDYLVYADSSINTIKVKTSDKGFTNTRNSAPMNRPGEIAGWYQHGNVNEVLIATQNNGFYDYTITL